MIPNEDQLKYIFDQLGYVPTSEQWAIHLDGHRIRIVAGGERAGKSRLSSMDLIARMFGADLLWLVAQDYERTRAEFNYIIEALVKLKIGFTASKQIDPGEINTEIGTRIITKSAKDPRKLAMEAPNGILGCEGSQLDYETFLRLRGRLAEKRGWMLLSGTFESSLGWYVDLFMKGQTPDDELKSFSLPTWTNLAIFPGGRTDPEILNLEAQFSKEWFDERFGGKPTPPRGLVFPEFHMDIHVTDEDITKFDPGKEVYLWIDAGYATAYAVLVAQKRDDETVAIIDEVYERGFVTEDIITICKKKPWWNQVIGGAIDVAAKQHQAMSSPVEEWLKKGGLRLRSKKIRIQDSTEKVKTALKVNPLTNRPGIYIHPKCRGLISEMGGCQNPLDGTTKLYKWHQDREGNIIGEIPEDRNNHACKALAYGLIDMFGFAPRSLGIITRTIGAKQRYK